jgi:hypothetical protein
VSKLMSLNKTPCSRQIGVLGVAKIARQFVLAMSRHETRHRRAMSRTPVRFVTIKIPRNMKAGAKREPRDAQSGQAHPHGSHCVIHCFVHFGLRRPPHTRCGSGLADVLAPAPNLSGSLAWNRSQLDTARILSVGLPGITTATALSTRPITSYCAKASTQHFRRTTTSSGAPTSPKPVVAELECPRRMFRSYPSSYYSSPAQSSPLIVRARTS